ncbi:MAG: DUF6701 domain-containing protein [Burkholderiaceae bacterium]
MRRALQLIHSGRRPWVALALACMASLLAAQAARAQSCSPYAGQVTINEVRINSSGKSKTGNQIELFNSANIASSVWSTWQLVVWTRKSGKSAVKRGGYFLSSGFIAQGQFVFNNNNKNTYLQNRSGFNVDIALLDASGAFIDYIAIGGAIQTVPACLGAPKVVSASTNKDSSGDLARIPDGGAWPAAVVKTSVHTIGSSNTCTASGNDLVIQNSADVTTAVVSTTTVTYTITATNKNCSGTINSISVSGTAISTTNFSGLSYSASQGSTSQGASALSWTVGNLASGATATLSVTGKPRIVGTLVTTAAVTAPSSGLVNTFNDSDSETITVTDFNDVGFDAATATLTEGTDTSYSALIASSMTPTSKVSVSYTVSGSAGPADTDLPASGTVVIDPTDPDTPDETSIDFTIKNDSINEPTKTITLTITGVTSSDPSVRLSPSAKQMNITLLDDDSAVDHYELALPASSISCLPSTVTVTACADASNPCTKPYTAASVGSATLSTTGATLGATSVTFNASGQASTTLSYPAASNGTSVSVTLSGESTAATNLRKCCPNGSSCSTANSCATTFNSAGFIVTASANAAAATLPVQTAGTPSGIYYLRAVQTSTTTKACEAALSGLTSVNWAFQCNNPGTCSSGNLMSVTGSSATAIAGNPNSGVSTYTSVPMSFDTNGNAPFTFTYSDVGQASLWVTKTVNSATLSGTSNAFVTRPAGFTLSNIRQSASPNLVNPAAANAAGARFVTAGESFSATVTATTSGGAATPNYGKESSPEGVLLTRTLVLPSGGAGGTLANGSVAGVSFAGGAATLTTLSFSEVGIITLTPSVADADYLGAGNVSGGASANVGRFFPARFALSSASVTHRSGLACAPASSFTYLGENFGLGFTLTAQNSAGATTQNYTGSFAKLDPSSASAFNLAGLGGSTSFSVGSGRLALGSAAGSWSNGVAGGVALTANASRAAAPDGPFNAVFGIAPIDSDGVAISPYDMSSVFAGSNDRAMVATLALRFGRLRLSNAVGSQTRPLALPLSAQYWSGSDFDVNALDSCTTIPASAVSLGNLRRTLTLADTALSGGSFALSSGVGTLALAPPSAGRYGTVDVSLSLGSGAADLSCLQPWAPGAGDAATAGANLSFLRGAWCGANFDKDPSARASFGLYRGADAALYRRENY